MIYRLSTNFFKLFVIIVFCFVLLAPLATVRAAIYDDIQFVPNITIPNSDFKAGEQTPVETSGAGGNLIMIKYITALYKFFVGIAGIIAVFMIVFGGVLWLFSGGSSDKISKAKEIIIGAISGLVLAVGSYLILFTVNPNLVSFNISIPPVPVITGQEKLCDKNLFKTAGATYGDCGQQFKNTYFTQLMSQGQVPCTFTLCGYVYNNTMGTNKVCTKRMMYNCDNKVKDIFSLAAGSSYAALNTASWNFSEGINCGKARFNVNSSTYNIGLKCPENERGSMDSGENSVITETYKNYCLLDVSQTLDSVGSPTAVDANGTYEINLSAARCPSDSSPAATSCDYIQNSADGCDDDILVNLGSNIIANDSSVVLKMQAPAATAANELATAWAGRSGFGPAAGSLLTMSDVFRSVAYQDYMYCTKPHLANSTCQSYHELGLAFDAKYSKSNVVPENFLEFLQIAWDNHFKCSVCPAARPTVQNIAGITPSTSEAWHFTYQAQPGDSITNNRYVICPGQEIEQYCD